MLREAQPTVLSALLDAVATGLAKKDVVLEELPRMADFAVWGVATAEALGGTVEAFMETYAGSWKDASASALEAWILHDTFVEFAFQFEGKENAWHGTATELLRKLNDLADDEDMKRSPEWPKAPHALTAQINALKIHCGFIA